MKIGMAENRKSIDKKSLGARAGDFSFEIRAESYGYNRLTYVKMESTIMTDTL